jgi:hypothetical protein
LADHRLLSIVAIGRNEGANIARLGQSIESLRRVLVFPVEAIFVDSASTDDSVEQARDYFDCVAVLEESPMLCAAAGRAAGAALATGKWILFVDADMDLHQNLSDHLPTLLATDEEAVVGYVGDYVYMFSDGTQTTLAFEMRGSDLAKVFGGASVLRRAAVMGVGNWDASIFAHEELDLFLRLRAAGGRIVNVPGPMIRHWTDRLTRLRRVARVFLPSQGLGNQYFGIGQLFASRLSRRETGLDILRGQPFFALLLGGVLVGGVIGVAHSIVAGVAIIGMAFVAIAIVAGPGQLLVYTSWLVRIPFGVTKYVPDHSPSVRSIWRRTG